MSCCKNGNVRLDPLQQPPNVLKHFLEGSSHRSKKNLKDIRRYYNLCFAFTSMTCEQPYLDESNMSFVVHGQVCHYQHPLVSSENQNEAKYAKLYVYDPRLASNIRAKTQKELDKTTLKELTFMLQECNPYRILTYTV